MPRPEHEDTEHCPNCGSTRIHREEERYRPWVHDATCHDCGHHWKLSAI